MTTEPSEYTEDSPFDQLQQMHQSNWPTIARARLDAESRRSALQAAVNQIDLPEGVTIVVFGSLARGEWTSGSDIDWTLLIDSSADPEHFRLVARIEEMLSDAGFSPPGRSGVFGTMSSSHELVHHVGGSEDSNQNLTRRLLLLLESHALVHHLTHERVVRQVLNRYISCDPAVSLLEQPRLRVPRFLVNDFVRLWRTIAVDYATKKWQQSNERWALRNAKLRMSRKLLFVKALLLCFDCELDLCIDCETAPLTAAGTELTPDLAATVLVNRCLRVAGQPAVDVLCSAFLQLETSSDTVRRIMSSYDGFLEVLNDPTQRERLANLMFEEAPDDEVFQEVRQLSQQFRDGLEYFFFEEHEELARLTKKYGVF